MTDTRAILISRPLFSSSTAPEKYRQNVAREGFPSFREALHAAMGQIAKGSIYNYSIRYESPRTGIRTAHLHNSCDIYSGRVKTSVRAISSPTYSVDRLRRGDKMVTYFHSYGSFETEGEPRMGGRLRARRALYNGKKTPNCGKVATLMCMINVDAFWIFENFVWKTESSVLDEHDGFYATIYMDPDEKEYVNSYALSRGNILYHTDGVIDIVDRLGLTVRKDWFGRGDLTTPLGGRAREEGYYVGDYGYPSELYEAIVEHGIKWTHSPNAPILVTPEDAVLLTTILG